MKRCLVLFCCTLIFFVAATQRTDKKLQRQIESLVKNFNGDVGIYIKDLEKMNNVAAIIIPTIAALIPSKDL